MGKRKGHHRLHSTEDLLPAEEAFAGVIRRSVGLLSKDMGLLQRAARCKENWNWNWENGEIHWSLGEPLGKSLGNMDRK